MGLFSRNHGRMEKDSPPDFDREKEEPVVRCSICNGEMVAGFREKEGGHFREYRMLRSQQEIDGFAKMCKVTSVRKEY